MMRVDSREEDPKVNIMLQSGTTTSEDKGKQPAEDEWVRKAREKETKFDLECTKETFMEAKKSFAEASTSGGQEKPIEEMDPSMITMFLETSMKLLCDSKAAKGLHELINRCDGKGSATRESCIVRNLGKHKVRIGREMRLTT